MGLERGHRDLLPVSGVQGGIERGVRRAAEFLAMVEKDKPEAWLVGVHHLTGGGEVG